MQLLAQITNCTMLGPVGTYFNLQVAWTEFITEDYDTAQAFPHPDCATLNAPLADVYVCICP